MIKLDETYKPNNLLITREEAKVIWAFLLSCGYISHEFHADMHLWIDGKLLPFLGEDAKR